MNRWIRLVRTRVAAIDVDPAREADIVAELAQHVEDEYAALVAAGVPPAQAERRALAPLNDTVGLAGALARADRPRAASRLPPASSASWLANIPRDLRYAVRALRQSPGFAAAAILTFALGIGANAAIFSVVQAVILRPPPYRQPDRLVFFFNGRNGGEGVVTSSSLPDYEDWRRQLTSFDELGLLSGWTFNVTGVGLPERVFGARVTGSLFPLLGTPALLGRGIEPSDDTADGDEVLVLGYGIWQRLFGGDPTVVGRAVMLEGRPHFVVGVMPPRFHFPAEDTEVWAAMKDNMVGMPRDGRFMAAVGRLKPGVAMAVAQSEVDTLEKQLDAAYPTTNRGWRVELVQIHDALTRQARPPFLLLGLAVAFVLLIACVNVSSLLLARVTARTRETAIRFAIGAGRGRIVALWLTENLVLALLGAAVGVGLARSLVAAIVAIGPADVPQLNESAIDARVLVFTFAVAIAAGLLPVLLPALRLSRSPTHAALRDGFGGYAGGARGRAGSALIVAEVALAMTLAVAGTLLLRSFARLTAVDPGFNPDRVLTLKTFLTPPRYRTIASSQRYVTDALERIARIPGVESAAAISQLPLSDPSSTLYFEIDGQPSAPADRSTAGYRAVSAAYFRTLGIPILRGRSIVDDDRADPPWVAVVNDTLAKRFFHGVDPIGRRLRFAVDGLFDPNGQWLTIVGVAADVRSAGLDRGDAPAIYTPFTQRTLSFLRWTSFVARTRGEPKAYAAILREELSRIDPMQPVYQIASLDEVVSQSVAARRFHTLLIALFAIVALALASVGVYGTIGYWVAQRTREIGVRMALGAEAGAISRMVVGRAALLTAVGVASGLVLSAATSGLLASLLFGVQPLDPPSLVATGLLVAAVGIAAAYLPARRAARLDPLAVIRGT